MLQGFPVSLIYYGTMHFVVPPVRYTLRSVALCILSLRGLDKLRAEDAGLDSDTSWFYLSSGCHQKVCHHRLLSFVTTFRLLESIQ